MSVVKKSYTRDMAGLIDACFDELQDLRDGVSTANEATAFSKVANVILRGAELSRGMSDGQKFPRIGVDIQ